jgi:hypothetical protein
VPTFSSPTDFSHEKFDVSSLECSTQFASFLLSLVFGAKMWTRNRNRAFPLLLDDKPFTLRASPMTQVDSHKKNRKTRMGSFLPPFSQHRKRTPPEETEPVRLIFLKTEQTYYFNSACVTSLTDDNFIKLIARYG